MNKSDLYVLRTAGKYVKIFSLVVFIKQTEKVWHRTCKLLQSLVQAQRFNKTAIAKSLNFGKIIAF